MSDFFQTHALNLLFFVAIVAVFAVVERLRPVMRLPARVAFFNVALFATVYIALFLYYYEIARALTYVQDWRQAHLGVADFVDRDLGSFGLAVRFLLFAFIADLIKYWMHRAMHAVPFLWRFHQVHHSDPAVNASTHVREQWLGVIYNDAVFLLLTAPLFGVLSLPVPLTAAYLAYGFFVHANLRLPLGWLTPVIVGPQYHRIHHSLVPNHFHRNFAGVFPAIDMMFGTYYRPAPDEFPLTGLAGVRHDSVWRLQLLPFHRAAIPARSAADAAN